MNRSLRHLALLTGCVLSLSSPTCEDDVSSRREVQLEREALQAATEDFRSALLTNRNLEAFEFKAIEKLMDYADYLNIVYDQNLDEAFRNQAGENIMDLFADSSAPANPLPARIDQGSFSFIKFLIDTIDIITPLERQPAETYRGRMQYSLRILGITGSDTLDLDTSLHEVGMLLQMGLKDFGENSLVVWEVLLSVEK